MICFIWPCILLIFSRSKIYTESSLLVSLFNTSNKVYKILILQSIFLTPHYFCSLKCKEWACELFFPYSLGPVNFTSVSFSKLTWSSRMILVCVCFFQVFQVWLKRFTGRTIQMYLWLAKRKSANHHSTFFFNLLILIGIIILPH